jgi:hypothetical protein
VIYRFGREHQLDKEAVRRLVASLSRLLEPGDLPAAAGEGLKFAESRPYGGAYNSELLPERLLIRITRSTVRRTSHFSGRLTFA